MDPPNKPLGQTAITLIDGIQFLRSPVETNIPGLTLTAHFLGAQGMAVLVLIFWVHGSKYLSV
jgi:hypothetical protein